MTTFINILFIDMLVILKYLKINLKCFIRKMLEKSIKKYL